MPAVHLVSLLVRVQNVSVLLGSGKIPFPKGKRHLLYMSYILSYDYEWRFRELASDPRCAYEVQSEWPLVLVSNMTKPRNASISQVHCIGVVVSHK